MELAIIINMVIHLLVVPMAEHGEAPTPVDVTQIEKGNKK